MAWTNITDAVLSPGKRLFANTLRALRDNVTRIDESAVMTANLPQVYNSGGGGGSIASVVVNVALPAGAKIIGARIVGNVVIENNALGYINDLQISPSGASGVRLTAQGALAPQSSFVRVDFVFYYARYGALT